MIKHIIITGLFCTFLSAAEVDVALPAVVQAQTDDDNYVVDARRRGGKGGKKRRRGGNGLR
jgi:hypothetical protein